MADVPYSISGNFPTTAATLFTVPAGKRFIVRLIHVSNNNATNQPVWFFTRINGVVSYHLYNAIIPGYSAYDWSGFMALQPGTTIEVPAGHTTGFSYLFSGVEVDA